MITMVHSVTPNGEAETEGSDCTWTFNLPLHANLSLTGHRIPACSPADILIETERRIVAFSELACELRKTSWYCWHCRWLRADMEGVASVSFATCQTSYTIVRAQWVVRTYLIQSNTSMPLVARMCDYNWSTSHVFMLKINQANLLEVE
jgi:hypothetical protein